MRDSLEKIMVLNLVLSRTTGGTSASVSSIVIHPSYRSGARYNNDVAILRLSTSIPTSSTIGYATLEAQGSDPAANSVATVASWYVQLHRTLKRIAGLTNGLGDF